MELRIACSGPSGTGKTTLSTYIAEQYNIPFITTSTKPLWEKHGILSHAHLIGMTTNDPTWGLRFQHEVLSHRVEVLSKAGKEFVTDRSPIDNLAYLLMQNSHQLTERETESYMDLCNEAINLFTGFIIMPFTDDINLEDDGKRVVNRYYQVTMNHVFDAASGMLTRRNRVNPLCPDHNRLNILGINKWDMEERKRLVAKFLVNLRLKN
jgi:deoxyadenosine/deoxycytidine kinase